MNKFQQILASVFTLLAIVEGVVEYSEDKTCLHKSEFRYNQNPSIENELLREVQFISSDKTILQKFISLIKFPGTEEV